MSQENRAADPGELTRRLYETADRGDFDAMVRLFRPVRCGTCPRGIGTFEGATATRGFVEDWPGVLRGLQSRRRGDRRPRQGSHAWRLCADRPPTGSSGEVQIRFASIQICEDGLIVWMKN